MKPALILIAPFLLGACDAQFKSPAKADGNVTMSGDAEGNVSFDLPFAKGQVKLPAGTMGKGEFDIDGVKMIPGGTLTGMSVFAADKGSNVDIAFKSPRSVEDTRAYFLDQFRQKGVQAAASGDSIKGVSKDGDTFQISLAPAGAGSTGKIAIHSND